MYCLIIYKSRSGLQRASKFCFEKKKAESLARYWTKQTGYSHKVLDVELAGYPRYNPECTVDEIEDILSLLEEEGG